ncbi:MAG: peptidoglycan-binding domain-containing protein [Candidatus Omnitrophota bacterium]
MKKWLSLVVAVVVLAGLSGCGKKQEVEELQPITMESLSTPSTPVVMATDLKAQDVKALAVPTVVSTKEVVPVPPQGPYKPAGMEIQTALKNAGFYAGSIDGKIGPKSKKAIVDFQAANGLKADGKVGPKTWEVLSKYLSGVTEPAKR